MFRPIGFTTNEDVAALQTAILEKLTYYVGNGAPSPPNATG